MSDSSRPQGLQPTRLLHPWDFPGKSTGVGCSCLLCEKISSFSHSVVFLYFFALFTEEGFLISPCYSLELFRWVYLLAFKWTYLSFPPLPFASLLFSATCKSSSDNHFAFLHSFFLGMVLITTSCTMLQTSIHSSSGTLSYLIP